MAEALQFEQADKLGNPIKQLKTLNPHPPCSPHQAKKPCIDMTVNVPVDVLVVSSGEDNPNYNGTIEYTLPEDSELSTDTDWLGKYDTFEMMLCPSNMEVFFSFIYYHSDRLTGNLLDH